MSASYTTSTPPSSPPTWAVAHLDAQGSWRLTASPMTARAAVMHADRLRSRGATKVMAFELGSLAAHLERSEV